LNDGWVVELDVDGWEEDILKYGSLRGAWIGESRSCGFSPAFAAEEGVN